MEDIHQACRQGDLPALQQALQVSHSSLNSLDPRQGWSPLYRCIVCGHEPATAFLLSQGANPNLQNHIGEGPLHQAAETGSVRVVRWLLEAGADPNLKQNGESYLDGETALHKAVARGDMGVVKTLLEFGANPNVQNATFGWTPLHSCAEAGNGELWDLLLSKGASDSILDWRGKAPNRGNSTLSNRSSQLSGLCKPSPEPQEDPPFHCSRSCSPIDTSKPRARKGSPPLVPRLRLDKRIHSSFDSALNSKSSCTVTKSQDLSFSFRDHSGKRGALERWLRRWGLDSLTDTLVEAGYDDLEQLLAQAQRLPISVEQLQGVGLRRKGHALRLLAALELELQTPDRRVERDAAWECCEGPDSSSGISAFPSLQVWLKGLGLEQFHANFIGSGFEDLEPLLLVMKTSYALTETALEQDFGIDKPGHRHRLLSKLREDCVRFDPMDLSHTSRVRLERSERTVSCELCGVM